MIGENFRFGNKARGDAGTLRSAGLVVDEYDLVGDGEPVSSTRIRSAVAQGHVAAAAEMLGRPHEVGGMVVMGEQRGRELGFPTANLDHHRLAAVPAAIAARVACPDRTVVCFAGDGDFQMNCQELATALQAGAQPIVLAHHLLAYVSMFQRDTDRLMDAYRRADRMTLGSGALAGVTYGTIGKISGAPRTRAEFDGTARFIERAARAAKGHGLKLGVEPCNRYETHIMNTGADGRAYCEAAGQDNVFIHLDSYHMNIEERSLAQGIRDCGEWLGYFHLSESNRAAPGHGTIDWAEVYATLVEVGFDGITTLESMNHVHPAIASALAIWHPVEPNPDDVIDAGLPCLHRAAEAAGFSYE